MMRKLVLAALIGLTATSAFAQRPSTLGMSCSRAQSVVAKNGAIVLSTGRHTYDRFVSRRGYCSQGEWAYVGTAPTADSSSCVIGYVCKAQPPLFEDDDHFGGGLFRF